MSLRRIAVILVLLVALALIGAVAYAAPLLLTGTGYAAHNACAVQLLAGRDADAPAADLPPNPLVPVMSSTVDAEAGRATASVFGLFSSTAWYTPGLGCTLADERPDLDRPDPVDPQPWPDGAATARVDVAALEGALATAFAEGDPEGRLVGTRAVAVVHDGTVVAERYAAGFDPDTPQLGWSMAKSVTNAMVGRLVADGVLEVEEDGLLDSWADDSRHDITLDDLLRMVSGLQWDETYSLGSTITEMLYLEPDMGEFAASQPLAHEPGTYQQYSSGTTNIICDVLAERAGLGADMATELVLRPAGMASAVLEPDAAGDPVCSSYLWASPRDWARFGVWFLEQEGGLLPDGWIDYSTTTIDVEGEEDNHGAHWWVNRRTDGSTVLEGVPDDAFWASGHDGQRLYLIPSADLVVVRMGFTPEIPSGELGYETWLPQVVEAVGG